MVHPVPPGAGCFLSGERGNGMAYTFKSHPTFYSNVYFRSRLEARWACFFDLVGWEWEYEPFDLNGWTPDFRVEFYCGHSACPDKHVLLVEVKPYSSLEKFEGHPYEKYSFGVIDHEKLDDAERIACASAAFGFHPKVTGFDMCHGAGAGFYSVYDWLPCVVLEQAWKEAGNVVQWRPVRHKQKKGGE